MAALTGPSFAREPALPPAARNLFVLGVLALHLAAGWGLLQMRSLRQALVQASPVLVSLVAPHARPALPAAQAALPAPAQPRSFAPRATMPPRDTPVVAPATLPIAVAPAVVPAAPHAEQALAAPPSSPPFAEAAPAALVPVLAPAAPPSQPAPAHARAVPPGAVSYLVQPQPVYPPASRRLGESGEVLLRVEIGTDGRARHVALHRSSGFARLDECAIAAMRAVRFAPFTENGVAWVVWTIVPIAFELQG